MTPLSVQAYIQKTDALVTLLEQQSSDVDIRMQAVFSNHLVLKASGLVEFAVRTTLSEYARTRSDSRISRFTDRSIRNFYSLNCERIETILGRFEKSWWPSIKERMGGSECESLDSLKTLRDQIAHGENNGTGLITVKGYYGDVKNFVEGMGKEVLG